MARIVHLVYLRFRDSATQEEIGAWAESHKELLGVDGLEKIDVGADFAKRGNHPFTHAVVMYFRDEKALDNFKYQPQHDRIRQRFTTSGLIAQHLVIDFDEGISSTRAKA